MPQAVSFTSEDFDLIRRSHQDATCYIWRLVSHTRPILASFRALALTPEPALIPHINALHRVILLKTLDAGPFRTIALELYNRTLYGAANPKVWHSH